MRTDLHPWLEAAGWEEFRELWLTQPDKPDALLIADDNLYRGAAAAILELGIRVPQDLLVVTHSNRGSGMLYPVPAARLEFDPAEFALRMGEMLWRLMQNEPDVPQEVTVPCRFAENPAEQAVDAAKSWKTGRGNETAMDPESKGRGQPPMGALTTSVISDKTADTIKNFLTHPRI